MDLERLPGGQDLPYNEPSRDSSDHELDRPTGRQLAHSHGRRVPLVHHPDAGILWPAAFLRARIVSGFGKRLIALDFAARAPYRVQEWRYGADFYVVEVRFSYAHATDMDRSIALRLPNG
jgi:hypothetical protein